MLNESQVSGMISRGRTVNIARTGDEELGPLKLLPGTWKNGPSTGGRGWNMIALPFATQPGSRIDYRLLLNQYEEELKFSIVDKAVPNRGIDKVAVPSVNTDQFVVTLDFEQMINQLIAVDNPVSGLAGPPKAAIHHEPGLWLYLTNQTENGIDIARLSTIPHGNSLLALGKSVPVSDGPPVIPPINGLPIGVTQDIANNPYLSPYKVFNDSPFKGTVTAPGFPGFDPVNPHLLLVGGAPGKVVRTTTLEVKTTLEGAGIANIPFVVKQADATEMTSTFWLQELEEKDAQGNPKLILQYAQVVFLDFFARRDGQPGRIRWPHVSINTMEKVDEPNSDKAAMPY